MYALLDRPLIEGLRGTMRCAVMLKLHGDTNDTMRAGYNEGGDTGVLC